MSYCQSSEFRVYFQQMIIDSTGEIRELPRVQSNEQIVLMPAAACLVWAYFFVVAKTMSIANVRLNISVSPYIGNCL